MAANSACRYIWLFRIELFSYISLLSSYLILESAFRVGGLGHWGASRLFRLVHALRIILRVNRALSEGLSVLMTIESD